MDTNKTSEEQLQKSSIAEASILDPSGAMFVSDKAQQAEKDTEYMHGWKLWLMLFGLWMGSMIIAIDQTM